MWSAWADAVGFISELTNDAGLKRRTAGSTDWPDTMAWNRRVGGKFGVNMRLPRGTYSDDTQLRLATGRAISSAHFDVDAFARVEMTIWPSYALGGGRASKAAAANLARPTTRWFTNFYEGYFEAGGNGAAMRIQPHIWALGPGNSPEQGLHDVLRNAVTTHGHPRALVGAVLHAVFLDFALGTGCAPEPVEFSTLLKLTEIAGDLFHEDPDLQQIWVPAWEQHSKESFKAAWIRAIDECRDAFAVAAPFVTKLREASELPAQLREYKALTKALDLHSDKSRGSGTLTVVAAAILAASFPRDPRTAALIAVQDLGTDTDTIATMAAAISGTGADTLPEPDSVQDASYILGEARRLCALAEGTSEVGFRYPDLLRWNAPRSQLDAVLQDDRGLLLSGLGRIEPIEPGNSARVKNQIWQWTESEFGPTFLVKHRDSPKAPYPSNRSVNKTLTKPTSPPLESDSGAAADPNKIDRSPESKREATSLYGADRVSEMYEWVAKGGFDARRIAYAMQKLASITSESEYASFALRLRRALLESFDIDREEPEF
ncbi:ADP-ribosylglycohydrolase family protein [Paenarthrobacter nitroguajacolicus]|uniref:ADP-ribosylglycohydrolase family protein n=1 Tax=Paenarthrobacter nitroguajacolicus TaxID=211146 RepID=UPI0021186730|nr:ADP-ribosylglycohydrolase family protein [Paenarthrobacter nitroguajacolicus]